jgi:hypothetical protein
MAPGMQYQDSDERSPSKDIPKIPEIAGEMEIARVARNRNRVELSHRLRKQGGRHAGPQPQTE